MGKPGEVVVHDFKRSLRKSSAAVDEEFWARMYKQLFPTLSSMTAVRSDGWAQRAGIDRVLVLKCGRTIEIDEKVRDHDYGDILLERWSDAKGRVPGWVQKPLKCEFIAYVVLPSHKCSLIPVLPMQRAWMRYGRDWSARYRTVQAVNRNYITESVAVPVDVLSEHLSLAMTVYFGP